jgi:uncharacterized membrane protein YdjX (TVP38/TMEM64 family)
MRNTDNHPECGDAASYGEKANYVKKANAVFSSSGWRKFWPLALLAGCGLLVYAAGWSQYLDFKHFLAHHKALTDFVSENMWLSLLAFALLYGLTIALSLPVGSFLTILGGFLFGPVLGGTITVAAATLGAMLVFLIARSSMRDAATARIKSSWMARLRRGFMDNALSYMLFLRLAPIFPFWLVNIAPALLGVAPRAYFLGTFFGIIPATYAFSYVGAGLGAVIRAQQHAYDACAGHNDTAGVRPIEKGCEFALEPGDLIAPEIILALCALAFIALLPIAARKLLGTGGED